MLQAPVVRIAAASLRYPWIAIDLAAVAKFKYPAECVAHKCLGQSNKETLYYSFQLVKTVQAGVSPALHTHLWEHHGDLAVPALHGRAADPPRLLAPGVQPCMWFYDLPALATLRGTVAVVDIGATWAGMSFNAVGQSGPLAYQGPLPHEVGTSQEGEALILLSYIDTLAQ